MANYFNDIPQLAHYLNHPLARACAKLKERDFAEAERYDFAPVDTDDAMDSYRRVLEIVGELCAEQVAPQAYSVDQRGPTLRKGVVSYAPATAAQLDAVRKAGIMGMTMPREYGGLNFPTLPFLMAAEMISTADASLQNVWGLQSCAETLKEFGTPEQAERYLRRVCEGQTMSMDLTEPDAGSDLQSAMLRATWDEKSGCWRLNGVKRFITNGDADIHLVLARSEEGSRDGRGLSMFIYDREKGGMTVRRIERKMGIKGSPTCELVFRNAPAELCGSRRLGLIKYVMSLMNSARLGIAAQSVGISQATLREASTYARERKQFGKTILEFPAVAEMVNNIEAKLHASRAILYETGRYVDMYKSLSEAATYRELTPEEQEERKRYQKLSDSLTPLAKGMAGEYANQNAYDCVQVHGGSGYMSDYTCERLYRDARITTIYEGTTQMQVVAAIRYATSGHYSQMIADYDKMAINEELMPFKERLRTMTTLYESSLKVVNGATQQTIDLMARRIVEMAGSIIMGYLTLADANDNRDLFGRSATNYIAWAEAEVAKHSLYIRNNTPTARPEEEKREGEVERAEIKKFLPHREPMLLVDRMWCEGDEVVGEYTIRGDEFFLQGHFPGRPIVPGVILCEIMGQCGSLLVADELEGHTPIYTSFEKARFRRPVGVGDRVVVRSRIARHHGSLFYLDSTATVNDTVVCSATLAFMIVEK